MTIEDKNDHDVVVVGAGLAGLTAAVELINAGLSVSVVEASKRAGGRIHALRDQADNAYLADLGPTWVWPQFQPIAAAWLDRLGVETFEQFDDGDAVLEYSATTPVQRQRLPGQYGIRRIVGGPQKLIDQLLAQLPSGALTTNTAVEEIRPYKKGVLLTTNNPDLPEMTAGQVVVATPLRVAAERIKWSVPLEDQLKTVMQSTPTWMSTHAKVVAIYDRPFWREDGLSGRIASSIGPIVEAHDHSGPDGSYGAIFGFLGWSHELRQSRREQLEHDIRQQLIHCLGAKAGSFNKLVIEDWAANPYICSAKDLAAEPAHPIVAADIIRAAHFGGRVFFAVAETATQSPGLIEGALQAGSASAAAVLATSKASAIDGHQKY